MCLRGGELAFFYCCATCYHKLRGQKQHIFISSQSGIQALLNWVLCLGSTRLQSRCPLECVLIWRLLHWERTEFQVHASCWQNSLPEAVSLRVLAACRLPARGSPQIQDVPTAPCHVGSSIMVVYFSSPVIQPLYNPLLIVG